LIFLLNNCAPILNQELCHGKMIANKRHFPFGAFPVASDFPVCAWAILAADAVDLPSRFSAS